MARHESLLRLGLLVAALMSGDSLAQDTAPEPLARPTIFELQIGRPAAEQPTEFIAFACGTNGGPPSTPLTGFADFARCPVEDETGLHEVAFQYDDEAEYWALAHNIHTYAERYHGTRIANYDVIASALFDDSGVLRGIRAMTDDRASLKSRFTAYQLTEYLRAQLSVTDWACTDLPPAEGETPVARRLIKQNCRGTTADGLTALIETRALRRKGQAMVDPFSGVVRGDRFVASSRFELLAPSIAVPQAVGADR